MPPPVPGRATPSTKFLVTALLVFTFEGVFTVFPSIYSIYLINVREIVLRGFVCEVFTLRTLELYEKL